MISWWSPSGSLMYRQCSWISWVESAGQCWISLWMYSLMISFSTPKPRSTRRALARGFGDPEEGETLCQILQMWVLVAQGAVRGARRQPEGYLGRISQDQGRDAMGGSEDRIWDLEFPRYCRVLSEIYLGFLEDCSALWPVWQRRMCLFGRGLNNSWILRL